tara:strand:- start:690 stop:866 length:177 start_codon:yes stop_codon:yes gene_type:complete
MKYKAKKKYRALKKEDGFMGLKEASIHIILLSGGEIEWEGSLPKKLKDCLTEIKKESE